MGIQPALSRSHWNATYSMGMSYMPKVAAASIPVKTGTLKATITPAPAPLAGTSGIRLRIKTKLVIITGQNLSRAICRRYC